MAGGWATPLLAVGQFLGGVSQAKSYRRSAAVDMENARLTTLSGEFDVLQTLRDERLATGAGLASAAADGMALGTGTMADLVEQAAINREMDILHLRAKAAGEARNLVQSAADKRRAATSALVGGLISAGTTVAAGRADARNQSRLSDARTRARASEVGRTVQPPAVAATRASGPGTFAPAFLPGDAPFALRRRRFGVFGLPGA